MNPIRLPSHMRYRSVSYAQSFCLLCTMTSFTMHHTLLPYAPRQQPSTTRTDGPSYIDRPTSRRIVLRAAYARQDYPKKQRASV